MGVTVVETMMMDNLFTDWQRVSQEINDRIRFCEANFGDRGVAWDHDNRRAELNLDFRESAVLSFSFKSEQDAAMFKMRFP